MTFRAHYDGNCAFCGEPIEKGDEMGFASGKNTRGRFIEYAPACADCAEKGLYGDESDQPNFRMGPA